MTTVEVLAPLRIETRFASPDSAIGQGNWVLRIRVYPDEFSMARQPPPPSPDELDRLNEALAGPSLDPPVDFAAAFAGLAAVVGAPRALWLYRNVPTGSIDRIPQADRAAAKVRDETALPVTDKPFGLPPRIDIWLVRTDGPRDLVATLSPDRTAIAADLDLAAFQDETLLAAGELPQTWFLSYQRAVEVGLAADINLGADIPDLDAIVVTGLGDTDPAPLIDAHAASGRLAILAQGTPTNTVEGEPTAELGRDPAVWAALVSADPAGQPTAQAVIGVLSGNKATPQPLMGGDLDDGDLLRGTLITALWPVLWGRTLRDIDGVGQTESQIAGWASWNLAPEGPYPAIRVGEQPYGLLPTTSLEQWINDGSNSELEERLRYWTMAWRDMAASAAASAGTAAGATTERLVALLGESAPSDAWGVRPIAPLALVRAARALAGLPAVWPSDWERETGNKLADLSWPAQPIAPFEALYPLPPKPLDRLDDADTLVKLLDGNKGVPLEWNQPLGLLGHLIRENVILLRAGIGQAWQTQDGGQYVDPGAPLPLIDTPNGLYELVYYGSDAAVVQLRNSGDLGAEGIVKRFDIAFQYMAKLIEFWKADSARVFAALLAALDTTSHRVDPWITGIANSRLRQMMANGAPFMLGAYGWVDRPRPFIEGDPDSPPAPGPTEAGLLHAPSHAQALTAALLRDARIRFPDDDRWDLTIDSAKTRAAIRLAERVRLGVHPYEALGLEVERLAGDWNVVRMLRTAFPLRASHEGRRCCDGARVLRAVLHQTEVLPAGLPAGLAATLAPLDRVLDTYADLLVADGVHALVSGRGDLGNAAMEAAAGLGAPPELRAVRTPRGSTDVRVSAWALLPAAEASIGVSFAAASDPAFAALLDKELGLPDQWRWTVGDGADAVTVSLANRDVLSIDLLALDQDGLNRLLRGDLGANATVRSAGGAEKLASANRLADLLGGGDDNPPVPDIASGRDDIGAAPSALRDAMIGDLTERYDELWNRAGKGGRPDIPPTVNDLRRAIRALGGEPRLPILPMVDAGLLPPLTAAPLDDDGHPGLDLAWLEIVAAVRPRLALLEARQLDPDHAPWPAAIHAADGSSDPWTRAGPVAVAYGPGVGIGGRVAIAGLDAWVDSIPSSEHVTSAAFGFNGPKARAQQAVLLAVPPDITARTSSEQLLDIVLETRLLVRARADRPGIVTGSRIATPTAIVSAASSGFLRNWKQP